MTILQRHSSAPNSSLTGPIAWESPTCVVSGARLRVTFQDDYVEQSWWREARSEQYVDSWEKIKNQAEVPSDSDSRSAPGISRSKSSERIAPSSKPFLRSSLHTPPRIRLPRKHSSASLSTSVRTPERLTLVPSELGQYDRLWLSPPFALSSDPNLVAPSCSPADECETCSSDVRGGQGGTKGGFNDACSNRCLRKSPHQCSSCHRDTALPEPIVTSVLSAKAYDPPISCPARLKRPALNATPSYSFSNSVNFPPRSTILPAPTSQGDLDILPRIKEIDHPAVDTIWICSRPTRSPTSTSSPSLVTPPLHIMDGSLPAQSITSSPSSGAKLRRPFVTYSTTVGRMADNSDTEGRPVYLSSHSDRILQTAMINHQNLVPGETLGRKYHLPHSVRTASPSPDMKRRASALPASVSHGLVKKGWERRAFGKQSEAEERLSQGPTVRAPHQSGEERERSRLRPKMVKFKVKKWLSIA